MRSGLPGKLWTQGLEALTHLKWTPRTRPELQIWENKVCFPHTPKFWSPLQCVGETYVPHMQCPQPCQALPHTLHNSVRIKEVGARMVSLGIIRWQITALSLITWSHFLLVFQWGCFYCQPHPIKSNFFLFLAAKRTLTRVWIAGAKKDVVFSSFLEFPGDGAFWKCIV